MVTLIALRRLLMRCSMMYAAIRFVVAQRSHQGSEIAARLVWLCCLSLRAHGSLNLHTFHMARHHVQQYGASVSADKGRIYTSRFNSRPSRPSVHQTHKAYIKGQHLLDWRVCKQSQRRCSHSIKHFRQKSDESRPRLHVEDMQTHCKFNSSNFLVFAELVPGKFWLHASLQASL